MKTQKTRLMVVEKMLLWEIIDIQTSTQNQTSKEIAQTTKVGTRQSIIKKNPIIFGEEMWSDMDNHLNIWWT